jgi:NitT/TauT family transport system substrate-binding protein
VVGGARVTRFLALALATLAVACGGGIGAAGCSLGLGTESSGETVVRIPKGAGGVGFLPLMVMEKHALVEKHARDAGLPDLRVQWIELGGPAVLNDALLSGAVDFIAAGPPAFLTLWDRTRDSLNVKGVAAITSLPMYLNTRADHLKTLDDVRDGDKIAVTGVKVSIPSIIMQMYAPQKYGADQATRFDRYTVTMTHPDGVIALLSGGGIAAHFTSPPFHERERADPRVRTILRSDDVLGGSTTFTMLSTTAKYREDNPAAYAAVLAALDEANRMITDDIPVHAALLAQEGGFTAEEMVTVLRDPAIKFTTTPENVLKYAEFMQGLGTLRAKPAAWTELFFPEIHAAPGS